MKIVLVNAPWKKGSLWGVRAGSRWPHIKTRLEQNYLPFPFFLAYAASLLQKNGFEVRVIDALAGKMNARPFLQAVVQENPDLVVAETSTPSLINDLAILRRLPPDVPLALCGPEAGIRHPRFLREHDFVDFVLVGEYEFTLCELARALAGRGSLKAVRGLIVRSGDEVCVHPPRPLTADLDVLPWPLRDGLPMSEYNDTPGGIPAPSAQMWASRGCPYQCLFCLWPQLMYQQARYRVRSVRDVVDEMEYLVRQKGYRSVYFDDDTFNIGTLRMLEFAREIRARSLNVPWAVMARADLFDKQVLDSLKEAGLAAVKYGVESAEQSLVDNCNKSMDLGKAERIIAYTISLGIKTHLTFTFGLPGETPETIDKTIDFALRMNPDSVQFSITTAFPGTRYFDHLDEKGYIMSRDPRDYDGSSTGVLRTEALGPAELEKAKRRADRIWYAHVIKTRSAGLKPAGYLKKVVKSVVCDNAFVCLKKVSGAIPGNGASIRLEKFKSYCRAKGAHSAFKKAAHNYLDMLGVFHGAYAYKGPDCVQIDLTNHCNNNCIGCWCNSPLLGSRAYRGARKFETLPAELVRSLIDELAGMGTKELYFSGGGEPFMHPDLLDLVGHAKRRGLVCTIHTNFTLVSEETVRRIIGLGLDHLTVSVWAGTPQTYAATHPNKDEAMFRRIHDTLCMLNALKKNAKPTVKVYHVVSNVNYHEIRQMAGFAHRTGSESVEFTVIDTIPRATDSLVLSDKQRAVVLEQCELIQGAFDGLRILNLEHFMRRLSDKGSGDARYDSSFIEGMPCYIGWLFARVMPNGDVNSCLKSHRFPVGNLYEDSFSRIWNAPAQVTFRLKTNQADKTDPFFSLIGNDPDCAVGCYKSCDDVGRNTRMFNMINHLSLPERILLRAGSRLFKPGGR